MIWLNALEMIHRHQLLGAGPGCFTFVYPRMRSAFLPVDPEWLRYPGAYTNAAHNEILQAWAETGPVGVIRVLRLLG